MIADPQSLNEGDKIYFDNDSDCQLTVTKSATITANIGADRTFSIADPSMVTFDCAFLVKNSNLWQDATVVAPPQ